MIILGKPIHRKYIKRFAIILLLFISVFLMSCSKLDFDPTTTTLKYIFKESKNVKQ